MLGQVAALREQVCTIRELHEQVSTNGIERLNALREERDAHATADAGGMPADVAVIGLSCLLPQAENPAEYWSNIIDSVDAVTEIPPERWDWRPYFDDDPAAQDKIYSKWGGFLKEVPFDPLEYLDYELPWDGLDAD